MANVPIWGERLQMLQVQVQPERMAAHDVSLEQVMETTAAALDVGLLKFSNGAVVGTGGFIDTPNQRIGVQHVLPIATPADLARVPVEDGPTAGRCAWGMWPRWSRTTSRSPGTRSSTAAPASC